jgi:hypothetical protein
MLFTCCSALSTSDLSADRVYCDVEIALFFAANSRYSIQCALIASIIGKAGARLEARDISLDQRISVFPQREYRELLNIEGNANSEVTCCVEN